VFAVLCGKKGGKKIMRQYKYLPSLILAGLLLGHPARSFANDNFARPMNPDSSAMQPYDTQRGFPIELADQSNVAQPFDIADVDYCYKGSVVDPDTGEMMDLYALCTEDDETAQDLA